MSRRSSTVLLVVLIAVTAARVAMVWVSDAVITVDSSRYRDTSDPFSTFVPLDGRGPGVLAQAWFLLPLPIALVAQTLIACALYGFGVWFAVRGAASRLRVPVAVALVAWMSSPWFLLWDAWVVTEAGALAGCFLAAVGAGRLATRSSGPGVMMFGLAVAVAARPITIIVLVPVAGLALLMARDRPRWRAAVALFVLISSLGAAHAVVFEKGTELSNGRNVDGLRAASRLMERSDHAGYLDAARKHGMPACDEVDAALAAGEPDFASIWDAPCSDFRAWLDEGGLPWTAELRSEPVAMLAGFVDPDDWATEPMSPYWMLDGRFYTASEVLGSSWRPLLTGVNILMFAALAGAVAAAAWPRGPGRLFSLATVAICLGVSFVAWANDGMEYWRHLLPSFAVLFPAVIAARSASRRPVSDPPPVESKADRISDHS